MRLCAFVWGIKKKKALKIPPESSKNTFIPEKTAKNSGRAEQSSAIIAKEAAKPAAIPVKPVVIPGNTAGNLSNLLSSLKLPQDNLSRSIIAFSRFFSLPLESKLLHSIRSSALSAGVPHREAAALAQAAVSDKGLKLDKKALGEYAAAIGGSAGSFTEKRSEAAEKRSETTGEHRKIKDKEDK